MAIYRTGQASMDAQGYITGYGTKWRATLSLIRPGATVMFATNPVSFAQVTEVVSDTSMRAINTGGKAVGKVDYVILLHDAITVDGLAQDVAETLRYYQGKETEFAHFIEIIKSLDMENLESIVESVTAQANRAKSEADKAKASQDNAAKSATTATQQANTAKGHADTAKQQVVLAQNAADFASNQSEISADNASRAIVEADRAAAAAKKAEDLSNSLDSTKLLRKDKNLEDLADKAAARRNLGVDNIEQNDEEVRLMTKGKDAWLSLRQSDRKWGMWDGVTKKWVPLGLEQGGTGASDAAGARGKLGLGTAATRNVGVGANDVMQVGAFGLGVGSQHQANALQRAAQFFRSNNTTTGRPTDAPGGNPINTATGIVVLPQDGSPNTGYLGVALNGAAYVGYANQTATAPTWWRIYTTQFKPTKADVGLSNVTNDAQVKKAGDTMTGDLAIKKGTPVLQLQATNTDNAVFRFYNSDGSPRGLMYAPNNVGATVGYMHLRAYNGSNASYTYNFDSTGKFTAVEAHLTRTTVTGKATINEAAISSKLAAKDVTINGATTTKNVTVDGVVVTKRIDLNNDATDANAHSATITGAQHTPLLLERPSATSNLSIGFKLNTNTVYRLGIDASGDLAFGLDPNQAANHKVITKKLLDAPMTIGGQMTFSKGFAGGHVSDKSITGATVDLNNYVIEGGTDTGDVRYYHCTSQGGGANIANKPAGVDGNFVLRVTSLRKVSATDYNCLQELVSSTTSRMYMRIGSKTSWGAWREIVINDANQDVKMRTMSTAGNAAIGGEMRVTNSLAVGGASVAGLGSDKGVIVGSGATFREIAASKGLIISTSSSATSRSINLRPGGQNSGNNQVIIETTESNGGDTSLRFQQGARIRGTAGKALVASANASSIYLRPNGDANSSGQVELKTNGELLVGGPLTANGAARFNQGATVSSGNLAVNTGNIFAPNGKLETTSIELSMNTPYIDFHFNKSSDDFNVRLINDGDKQLSLEGNLRCSRAVRAQSNDSNESFVAWNTWDPDAAHGQLRIAPIIRSRFNGVGSDKHGAARFSMWLEEHVGSEHRGVFELTGWNAQPQYWQFNATGNIRGQYGQVQWTGTSDLRYKRNVEEYDGKESLDNIRALDLIKFVYIDDERGRVRRGISAQQAQTVEPCYVKKIDFTYMRPAQVDKDGNEVEPAKHVSTEKLVIDSNPLLMDAVCAIQVLSKENDALKDEVADLKAELAEIKAMIAKLSK